MQRQRVAFWNLSLQFPLFTLTVSFLYYKKKKKQKKLWIKFAIKYFVFAAFYKKIIVCFLLFGQFILSSILNDLNILQGLLLLSPRNPKYSLVWLIYFFWSLGKINSSIFKKNFIELLVDPELGTLTTLLSFKSNVLLSLYF